MLSDIAALCIGVYDKSGIAPSASGSPPECNVFVKYRRFKVLIWRYLRSKHKILHEIYVRFLLLLLDFCSNFILFI